MVIYFLKPSGRILDKGKARSSKDQRMDGRGCFVHACMHACRLLDLRFSASFAWLCHKQ